MAQLTAAHALLMGLSVAGLGLLFSLVQSEKWSIDGAPACSFLLSLLFLALSSAAGLGAMITRLLDFRLTAQKVRGTEDEPLTMFGTTASGYGKATWALFWGQLVTFGIGACSGAVAIGKAYLGDIIRAATS